MKNKYFGFLLNFHENLVLAHGPILELEAHGPMRGNSFFLKNGPKPRLGPWAYMRGITVICGPIYKFMHNLTINGEKRPICA